MIDCKVVVTGVNGFIGGSVAACLQASGARVVGLARRPVTDVPYPVNVVRYEPDALAAELQAVSPDVVLHAAGSASVAESIQDPHGDFGKSTRLFQVLLEGVRRSGTRPVVVFPSSAAVYGNPEALPVPENALLQPISPYGFHKLMCEQLAQEYSACYGLRTLVLRIFSTFGARQKRLLVWEIFNQYLTSARVEMEGTGDEIRDYLHVDDLAACLFALLPGLWDTHTVVNVASGTALPVRELAKKVGRILQSDKPVVYRGSIRPGDPQHWRADIGLFERLSGQSVCFDLDARLRQTIEIWRG